MLLSSWLGYLSWRYIETPFREKRWLASRRAIFGLFAVYGLVCIGLGGGYRILEGKMHGDEVEIPKPQRAFGYSADIDDPGLKLPVLGDVSAPPTFLLWGDSHAMPLAALFDSLGKEMGVSGIQLTYAGKAPLRTWGYSDFPRRQAVSERFKKKWSDLAFEVAITQELDVVFLVGYWEAYCRSSFPADLQETIRDFNRLGIKVVFVGDNPSLSRHPQRQAKLFALERWPWIVAPTPSDSSGHGLRNAVIYEVVEGLADPERFLFVDLAPTVLAWKSLLSKENHLFYSDDNHLSDAGALALRPLFEPLFRGMARP